MSIAAGSARTVSKLLHTLRRFGAWWTRCLLAGTPPRWRSVLGASEDRLLFSRNGDELVVRWESAPGERELTRGPWPTDAADLERRLGSHASTPPRWWVLPQSECLRRRLLLPAAAGRHLRNVVGFEIDRLTPFTADRVRYDVRVVGHRDDGQLEVELVVVPLAAFDALMQAAADLNVSVAGVDIGGEAGQTPGFNLLPPEDRKWARDPQRHWNLLLLVVAVLAAVGAASQLLGNRRDAVAAFEARLHDAAPQARQVAAQRDRLVGLVEGAQFLDGKRVMQPTVTEVWNEVTVRLPAGTWLERLSIEGDRVHMAGFSDDASSLVARMEGSPLWRKPTLTGALQSEASTNRARFTLIAELAAGDRNDTEAGHGDSGAQ